MPEYFAAYFLLIGVALPAEISAARLEPTAGSNSDTDGKSMIIEY
jgi:hypothetical protein